ncbi:MAG: ring finger protein HAC1 [Phycisphaerae bacterium]|nr:MAG: ring finger protein HAC1 [Phycisphaerae bacterium]
MKVGPACRGVNHAARVGVVLAALVSLGLSSCGRPTDAAPVRVTRVFGEVGMDAGQFSYPRCIDATDTDVWIIDKLARVQRLDAKTGACLGGWRMPEWENGKPTGVTLWTPPAGGVMRVIIADTHYHRVMIYDPRGVSPPERIMEGRGDVVASFGSYGEGDGQFIYPTDVAVLPSRDGRGIARLYVSEYGGHDRINVFEPAAGEAVGDERAFVFRFAFGAFGSGPGAEFNRPQSIAIDREAGELLVADACNHRIGRFTLDGTLVAWVGHGVGRGLGQMQYPYGITDIGRGRVMVAEFGGNRVQEFDLRAGRAVGVYGQAGRNVGELASPWGVAVSGGTVLILDSGNNRVQGMAVPGGMFTRLRDVEAGG